MIIQLNDVQYIVIDEEYNEVKDKFKSNLAGLTEWVEYNGVTIPEDHLVLTKEEVLGLVEEWKNKYINRDNEVAHRVLTKMVLFIQGDINARPR